MKLFQTIINITLIVSSLFVLSRAKDDEDVTAQAIRDMQAGMAGLKEASKNGKCKTNRILHCLLNSVRTWGKG